MDQRVRHIKMNSIVVIREFKDIVLAKSMNHESYYVLTGESQGYNWSGDWDYIKANAYYEERIIKRINITQELMKEIREMDLRYSENELILPYTNELVDIIIPKLGIVISNITEYRCRVEYTGLSKEEFEDKLIYRNELKSILQYMIEKTRK